ncbi:MAG TPA: DUF3126 family protein [Hellea balneolensis]|uniref:DUF3126 family protein n=1 Tax=Hellea balneolensis TaxID=287478 RepID=A0A7C5QRM4_9PROT|nr:DUF3126 family protein [Hellea balneolensis]
MTLEQIATVQAYLVKRLGNTGITIKPRKVADSVEVYLDGEILGLLYIDDEDPDDISYDLNIAILQQDLDEM